MMMIVSVVRFSRGGVYMIGAIQEWLELNPNSPSGLVWLKSTRNGRGKKGAPALACVNSNGYYFGRLQGRGLLAHRAVFALLHGYLPEEIDHLDGNRLNNAPSNLRAVTRCENQHNQRRATGVCQDKRTGKWRAQIRLKGVRYYLGMYTTEQEARAAYVLAKKVMHPTVPESYYAD